MTWFPSKIFAGWQVKDIFKFYFGQGCCRDIDCFLECSGDNLEICNNQGKDEGPVPLKIFLHFKQTFVIFYGIVVNLNIKKE